MVLKVARYSVFHGATVPPQTWPSPQPADTTALGLVPLGLTQLMSDLFLPRLMFRVRLNFLRFPIYVAGRCVSFFLSVLYPYISPIVCFQYIFSLSSFFLYVPFPFWGVPVFFFFLRSVRSSIGLFIFPYKNLKNLYLSIYLYIDLSIYK